MFWKLSSCQSHSMQIFSPSPYVVFSLCLWCSFAVQKLVSLIGSHSMIFNSEGPVDP